MEFERKNSDSQNQNNSNLIINEILQSMNSQKTSNNNLNNSSGNSKSTSHINSLAESPNTNINLQNKGQITPNSNRNLNFISNNVTNTISNNTISNLNPNNNHNSSINSLLTASNNLLNNSMQQTGNLNPNNLNSSNNNNSNNNLSNQLGLQLTSPRHNTSNGQISAGSNISSNTLHMNNAVNGLLKNPVINPAININNLSSVSSNSLTSPLNNLNNSNDLKASIAKLPQLTNPINQTKPMQILNNRIHTSQDSGNLSMPDHLNLAQQLPSPANSNPNNKNNIRQLNPFNSARNNNFITSSINSNNNNNNNSNMEVDTLPPSNNNLTIEQIANQIINNKKDNTMNNSPGGTNLNFNINTTNNSNINLSNLTGINLLGAHNNVSSLPTLSNGPDDLLNNFGANSHLNNVSGLNLMSSNNNLPSLGSNNNLPSLGGSGLLNNSNGNSNGGNNQLFPTAMTHPVARASPTTIRWLLKNFEPANGISLPRAVMYQHYCLHAKENGLETVNAASFGKLVRSVFVGLRTRRLGTRGHSKYHYYGIRMKPDSVLHDKILPGFNNHSGNSNNLDNSGCTYGQRQNTNLTNNPIDVRTTIDLEQVREDNLMTDININLPINGNSNNFNINDFTGSNLLSGQTNSLPNGLNNLLPNGNGNLNNNNNNNGNTMSSNSPDTQGLSSPEDMNMQIDGNSNNHQQVTIASGLISLANATNNSCNNNNNNNNSNNNHNDSFDMMKNNDHHNQSNNNMMNNEKSDQNSFNLQINNNSSIDLKIEADNNSNTGLLNTSFLKDNIPECLDNKEIDIKFRVYAHEFVDCVVNLKFTALSNPIIEFYKNHPTITSSSSIQTWLAQAEANLYQTVIQILFPSVIQPIPATMNDTLRSFSKNVVEIMNQCLRTFDGINVELAEKINERVIRFSKTIKRITLLNHLSLSIHTILKNTDDSQRMVILLDLNKISIEKVCDDCWIRDEDTINDIKKIWGDMKHAMLANSEASKIVTDWKETIIKHYEKYNNKKQFIITWNYIASTLVRDLTLRSVTSFGSILVLRLFLDELVQYIVLKKEGTAENKPLLMVDL